MKFFASKRTQRLTNFALAALLVLSTMTASVPFLFSQVANAVSPASVSVATLTELQDALTNPLVNHIELTADITTPTTLVLGRSDVSIQGNDFTISFASDPTGWQGHYVFQVYNAQNVAINSLRMTGGDAGLLVNGSKVTLTGHTHVTGNTFGGIEVSNGGAPAFNASLTSTNDIYNFTEANTLPTVWTDGANATFTDVSNTMFLATHINSNQKQYYLSAANTGTVATNTTQGKTYASLQAAFDTAVANDSVVLNENVVIDGKAAVINTKINFDGQNHTIKTINARGSSGDQKNAALIVSASGTTVKNVTVEGTAATTSSHGLIVFAATGVVLTNITAKNNASGIVVNGSTVQASNITTISNTWNGINVDKTGAALTISGVNAHNETAAIWVDDRTVGTVVDTDSKYTKIAAGAGDYYILDQTGPSVSFQVAPPAVAAGTIHVRPIALGEADGSLIFKQLFIDGVLKQQLNSAHRNYDINIDTTLLTEGTHQMTFVATDAAGNSSTVGTSFVVDNALPVIQIDGAALKAIYNLADPMSAHVIDAHYQKTVITRFNSDGTTLSSWVKVYDTGSYFGLNWLSDAKYQIYSVDQVGNMSVVSNFTVDRTAPATPGITNKNVFVKIGVLNKTLSWTIPDSTGVVSYEYREYTSYDNAVADTAVWTKSIAAPLMTTTDTASKTSTVLYWRVVAIDAAGNRSISSINDIGKITIDRDAPTSTNDLANLVGGTINVTQAVSDNYTPVSGKIRIWKLDSSGHQDDSKYFAVGNVAVDSSNHVVYSIDTVTKLFGDGQYVAKFTATDRAGNQSVVQKNFTVDNIPADITITPQTNTTDNQPTITGTVDDVAATLVATFDGVDYPVINNAGKFSFTAPAALANGTYSFSITATDANKNDSSKTADVVVAVASVPTPLTTSAAPAAPAPANPPTATTTVTPQITSSLASSVLGATTDTPNGTGAADVKGTTDDKTASAVNSDANQGKVFGLAWYWWILILAALASIAWYIAAAVRRHNEANA